ncbi:hypothetical protein PENTCL1PPCAC_2796, partial [Pristionchus entomophagus]
SSILGNVLHGNRHVPALTTVVLNRAIHEVLFRQGDILSILHRILTLDGTSGRERPASTACSLILDSRDDSGISPVQTIGDLPVVGRSDGRRGGRLNRGCCSGCRRGGRTDGIRIVGIVRIIGVVGVVWVVRLRTVVMMRPVS